MEAKIKAMQREVSQISEPKKGNSKKGLPGKDNKLSIPELSILKQRLTVLATGLKRYNKERETRRINWMVSTVLSKVYSQ